MKSNIRKWGNSLAIRIPRALADELGLKADAAVDIAAKDGRLEVAVLVPRPRYSLDELVAGITPENQHPEVDWGPPVGSEEW